MSDERQGQGGAWEPPEAGGPGLVPAGRSLPAVPPPEEEELAEAMPRLPRRRRRVGRIVRWCVVGLAALAVGGAALRSYLAGPAPVYAETGYALRGDLEQALNTSGTLASGQKVTLYAPATAPVAAVNAVLGGSVEAGQLVVSFDTLSLEQAYRQAAANSGLSALQAQQALENSDESQQAADSQQANIDNLQVQLANAQAALQAATEAYMKAGVPAVLVEIERLTLEQELLLNSGDTANKARIEEIEGEILWWQERIAPYQNNLSAAQADVAAQTDLLAKATAARNTAQQAVLDDNARQQLQAQQVPSQVAFENARRSLSLAAAGLTAPISGVVTALNADPGALVNQYAAVCVIESLDKVEVAITLSRYDLERVSLGQSAVVTSMGKTYAATVTRINQMATQISGTGYVGAAVTLLAPGAGLTLGLEASVSISTGRADDVVMVPVGAVNTDVNGTYCFIIRDGVAHRSNIAIGISSDSFVEVLSGVEEGDEVALYAQNLADGDRVTDDIAYAPQATLVDLMG